MLLPEALNEVQLITLRDVLRTSGLRERNIDDVMLLLWTKPHRAQVAFYYRACGLQYEAIGEVMGKPTQTVHDWVNISCSSIARYLTEITVKT